MKDDEKEKKIRSHFWLKSYLGPSEHFGSISPCVSKVFCWFLVLCLHIFCFDLMSQSRAIDASGTPVPKSPMQLISSNFGSFNGSGSDFDGMGTRSGSTTDEKLDALLLNLYTSRRRSRKFLLLRLGCPVWIHTSQLPLNFCDQTCRDGAELQHLHCTSVQGRGTCSASTKRFWFGKILAFTRTS